MVDSPFEHAGVVEANLHGIQAVPKPDIGRVRGGIPLPPAPPPRAKYHSGSAELAGSIILRKFGAGHFGRLGPGIHGACIEAHAQALLAKPGAESLAVCYGASLVTVRNALLLLASEGWIDVRHGSGCYVSRQFGTDRHVAILVELDILKPGTSPYFLTIVNRLRRIFSQGGQPYRLHIGFASEAQDAYGDPTCHGFLEDVEDGHVSGVVAVATLPRTKLVEPLLERNIPTVGMDFPGRTFKAAVCLDYRGMHCLGAQTLIQQGCRRLAMVGGGFASPSQLSGPDDFVQTILQNGLRYHPEWTRTTLSTSGQREGWDAIHEIWSASTEKPDGLFIEDDMILTDVDRAIRALGIRVPQQMQVVLATSKGIPHNASFPLIRIENDPEAIADKMAGLLLDQMAGCEPVEWYPVFGYKVATEIRAND